MATPEPSTTTPPPTGLHRNWPAWIAGGTCIILGFAAGMAIGTSMPATATATATATTGPSSTTSTAGESSNGAESPMEAALSQCSLSSTSTGVWLMDSGTSLELNGDYGSGDVTPVDIYCVLGDLGAPESVYARMGSTRALDGTQQADWDDFSATWTYHPDNGLNVILIGGSDA